MPIAAILQTLVFLALALVVGFYTWNGIRKGRILVGMRGGRETWMVRRDDPISFWIVIGLCGLATTAIVWIGLRGISKFLI
jgi:hypothetical protein